MIASLPAWLVSGPGRAVELLLGTFLLVRVGRWVAAQRSHVALVPVVGLGLLGTLCLVGGVQPQLWRWILATTDLTRIRWLMAGVSLLVLLVACESIRHSQLRERYALLWVGTGLLILLCALEPGTLGWFSRNFGMQYVTTVVAVVFTFLILVSFHFSIALSRAEKKIGAIAQRCAQLEARLEALERLKRS